ncbi:MAG: FAD binding domain-containing protein [Bradymonadia bacterium]
MLRIANGFIVENPTSLKEAFGLLQTYGDGAKLVAGGTDILPNIKHGLHAPEVLINLKSVTGLRECKVNEGAYRLGALMTIHQLATEPQLASTLPALVDAASAIAGPQLRRMGTLGGNICLDTRCVYINQTHFWRQALGYCLKKDGSACHVVASGKRCVAAASNDTAPVLIALGASLEIASPRGIRTLLLEDFYLNDGVYNKALAADEIVTAVTVPIGARHRAQAYEKLRVRGAIDFPMLNLALAFDEKSGRAENLDLIVSAIASRPKRIKRLPDGLIDHAYIERIAGLVFKQVRPLTNINGDIAWRREMAPVLLRRAFKKALSGV